MRSYATANYIYFKTPGSICSTSVILPSLSFLLAESGFLWTIGAAGTDYYYPWDSKIFRVVAN